MSDSLRRGGIAETDTSGFRCGHGHGSWLFRFSIGRWTWPEKLIVTASLVLLASLFHPWFYFTSFSAEVDETGGIVSVHASLWAVAILTSVILLLLLLRAGLDPPVATEPGEGYQQLIAMAAVVNAGLVLLAFVRTYLSAGTYAGSAFGKTGMPTATWAIHWRASATAALVSAVLIALISTIVAVSRAARGVRARP
jgi:hypothetical protein